MTSKMNIEFYQENGYAGPYDLLEETQISRILDDFENCLKNHPYMGPGEHEYREDIGQYWKDLGPNTHWFKSAHVLMPTVRELAKNKSLLELLKPILGPDIMLWGSQVIAMKPSQHHKWHIDVETLEWDSINVWISLRNTSEKATLKIVSKSHLFSNSPQVLEEKGLLDLSDDIHVSEWAEKEDPNAEIIIPSPKEGQVIFFHGKTWHSSFNLSDKERTSILLQYSTPAVKAKIPSTFIEPVVWHSFRPPCLMVNGEDKFEENIFLNSNS